MAEQNPKTPPGPKVSPTRTIVSLALLLIVGVICLIELRAGLGQMMTGKAMAAKSEEGAFSKVTLDEAKGMLSLAPSEAVQRDTPSETVYRYEWFSLLRPLMGESSPQLFLVASKEATPMALAFHTSAEEDPVSVPAASSPPTAGMPGMAGPPGGMPGGMGTGPGGGMGMGGGRGGRGGGGPGGPPRDRPAVEGDATTPETPTETPSTEKSSTEPAETPAPAKEGDAPATPEPATPEPGTPEPGDSPAPANP